MSRDWTPKEFDMISQYNKYTECPILDMTLEITRNGETQTAPLYTEQDKARIREFPKLSCIGINFICASVRNGVYESEKGYKLLQELEEYFKTGKPLSNPQLQEKTDLWYDGELVSGYSLEWNDKSFIDYVKHLALDTPYDEYDY